MRETDTVSKMLCLNEPKMMYSVHVTFIITHNCQQHLDLDFCALFPAINFFDTEREFTFGMHLKSMIQW
jgi:hypothetical protein